MDLSHFINKHAGETAWLFGKGPSFATFDFTQAGPLRVAINDVIAHVPNCQYGFANDGVAKWASVYQSHHILFQPVRCLHEFDSTLPQSVACEVVTFADDSDDYRLSNTRQDLARCLSIQRGTLCSALQILHVMGVHTVHLVGIDGGGQHAAGITWKTELRKNHAEDYNAIRSAAIDAADKMGLTLKFHNLTHTMETDGKITVKMLKNCFANAEPYAEGQIASFSPKVARELIANRAAQLFTEPVEEPIENAELPQGENAARKKKGK